MALQNSIADYLPESMFIRLYVKVFHDDSSLDRFPTASAYGFFFHEFLHFLHNVSTISGLAAFVNTIELWRCFRQTVEPGGFSRGSGDTSDAHLETLLSWLTAARLKGRSKVTLRPASLAIRSVVTKEHVCDSSGDLLNLLECEATVSDEHGRSESAVITIGTVELLECAAWLLEKRMVRALSPSEALLDVPVFPYRVVEALAEHMIPGVDEETVVACVLAALQSADAPGALKEVLELARDTRATAGGPIPVLRNAVLAQMRANASTVEAMLQNLEREFDGTGIMAGAVRRIVTTARECLRRRMCNPFFEFEIIREVAGQKKSIADVIGTLPVCAVLQANPGDKNAVGRDMLLSLLPEEDEAQLRTLHCVFDFVRRHRTTDDFRPTSDAARLECPFFTCCDLPLRKSEPAICGSTPWESADRPENGDGKGCWYALAVRITRPPEEAPPCQCS